MSITSAGTGQYMVNYSFKRATRVCDGRAMVSTVKRGEQNFIASIKAMSSR